jgi:hypothetical protein
MRHFAEDTGNAQGEQVSQAAHHFLMCNIFDSA